MTATMLSGNLAVTIALAAQAHTGVDTGLANQLLAAGIPGSDDSYAWLAARHDHPRRHHHVDTHD
jgi:hypothetical protein